MSAFDLSAALQRIHTSGARVCFYPSCGRELLGAVLRLDADVFVFADCSGRSPEFRQEFDKDLRSDCARNHVPLTCVHSSETVGVWRSDHRTVLVLFQDNNVVLDSLRCAGCQISTLVGFCDGCGEGGNYECVHEDPFLGKVLSIARSPLQYLTDHSRYLEDAAEGGRLGHRYFRRHCIHRAGWEFRLQCVLVDTAGFLKRWYEKQMWYESKLASRTYNDRRLRVLRALTLVCFKGEHRLRLRCCENAATTFGLSMLAEFRMRGYGDYGVLAQYEVLKV